jgi:hypothetical protein
MQPQIERRSHAQRVPMDQGVVEVSFLEYGETAPADAVNIAEGGLSLRASILPEVGTEMRCAFPMPDGQSIEAECEVVWAQHSGPYAGEFGLRFVDIARLDEERIRDYVDAHQTRARAEWDDSDPGDSDGGYVDDSDPGHEARVSDGYELSAEEQRELSKPPGIPDTIRLFIDGVGSPVAASVVHATHDALVVAQELPFLSVGTGIAAIEDGPKGRLASVELRMVNGVPRLMLTVLFKDDQSQPGVDDSAAPAVHNAVAYAKTELRSPLDTLPDEDEEVEQLAAPAPRAAAPAEATAGIVSARRDSEPPVLGRQVDARVSRAPARRAEVFARQAEEDDLEDLDDDLAVDAMDDDLDDLLGAAVHVCRPAPAAEADLRPAAPSDAELGDSPVDRLSFMLRTRTRQLSERAKPLTDRARDLSKQGARGILPALRTLFAQLVLFASALRKKAGPAAASLFGRTQATVARLRSGEGARVGTKGGRPVRRQQQSRLGVTGRPPAAQAEVETRLDPQRARRRTVFLSSVAFLLVGTTVWALTPGDEVSEVATASDDTASPSSSAMEAAAPPSTVVSPYVDASAQLAEPAPVMEAAPVPSGPTPGPLAEPTYPTLGEERPAAPGSVAGDSPYAEGEAEGATAAPEVQEGRTFGAESVSNARSFEITMSQPVRTLRGRAEGNGFVVDIPNALAISGARTISRNHPMVARSHILNHGDHSTLTIEFAEGQSPAYRVSARGAAIQIEIAR